MLEHSFSPGYARDYTWGAGLFFDVASAEAASSAHLKAEAQKAKPYLEESVKRPAFYRIKAPKTIRAAKQSLRKMRTRGCKL